MHDPVRRIMVQTGVAWVKHVWEVEMLIDLQGRTDTSNDCSKRVFKVIFEKGRFNIKRKIVSIDNKVM